ncbi:MAG: hypothetical protein OXM02_07475 [Bacteroidota bacterium]|nr:hypothetical protein [Bacteroidota bacterium]MDE2957159.1 hypothetical protein [Bacteroidota bacterium]
MIKRKSGSPPNSKPRVRTRRVRVDGDIVERMKGTAAKRGRTFDELLQHAVVLGYFKQVIMFDVEDFLSEAGAPCPGASEDGEHLLYLYLARDRELGGPGVSEYEFFDALSFMYRDKAKMCFTDGVLHNFRLN